jgi:transposase InsO family protein
MPWKEETVMSLRKELIEQAKVEGANISALCRHFGISRTTAYKWRARYQEGGEEALADRSRRPHHSPQRTATELEAAIVQQRQTHPVWGGRKIAARLELDGHADVPTPSTVTAVLRRHGLLDAQQCQKHRPYQRFEMAQPNELWQMDFKGYFALQEGGICHPFSVLDDHSRFLLGLYACPDQTTATVRQHLTAIFREYGLPERMLMDNGACWGVSAEIRYTDLLAWLIRLGIQISHGRPYHPQTQGKDERFHRTLKAELLCRRPWLNLPDCQGAFGSYRQEYNTIRPHEALADLPPATCYRHSSRLFPDTLPPITYRDDDIVRKVDSSGRISFRNHPFVIGRAFGGYEVALRPCASEGQFTVYFCQQQVAQINLHVDNC